MIVLGINSVYHESAAAIVVDGHVRAAVEEERFNRVKHGKPADVDTADVLPVQSIAFCLNTTGLTPADIDFIAYSFDPARRQSGFQTDFLGRPNDWGTVEGEQLFINGVRRVPVAISELLNRDFTESFEWVSHHLAHAASVYFPSGFENAAVMVIDGIGEASTVMLATGKGNTLNAIDSVPFPNSLGFLWEKLSKFLGFSEYDAAKVMGLAGYGKPDFYVAAFDELIEISETGFNVRADLLRFRDDDLEHLSNLFGAPRRREDPIEQRHYDIAAALQQRNDQAVLAVANHLYSMHASDSLCFAGGVALNCVTNSLLKEEGPFENIYIPPAPHDAGGAVGAALYTYFQNESFDELGQTAQHDPLIPGAYSGPAYDDEQIQTAFSVAGISARRSSDVAEEVSEFLANGQIVGWFQGAMEFGPRALGNRSLLADPRRRDTRERLNRRIKHREDFRPFGPSVLEEFADEWFEIGRYSYSYNYMLFAPPVRPEKADQSPAVLHADGTSRIQVVSSRSNERYHQLISAFHRRTDVPMVLNTSFNDNEPLVCTPSDACATFCGTEIDVLVLGDWIATERPG